MRIKRIRLWQVPLTSLQTYYMADGKTADTVESVVIALDTDNGQTGWGEACPLPRYLPAYSGGIAPALAEMAPLIIGADPVGPEALMFELDAHLRGHPYAKSSIDIALWDLTAQSAGLPLHSLLGGRRQATLPLYHSITCIAPDEMAKIARETLATGITQFQVKLGVDGDWETDVERLVKVREAVGQGPLVYGDWNCGATQLQATRVARAVQNLDVMLEQPCSTLAACASVHDSTGLPMKIDELAHDVSTLLEAHRLGILDAVALKLSKFGGLSRLRVARDLCLHLGTSMCIECTWGSDIVTAAALHLAAATDPQHLLNTCDLSGYVTPRLAPDAPTRLNGRIAPPTGSGLGVTPDLDLLGDPDVILD